MAAKILFQAIIIVLVKLSALVGITLASKRSKF